MTHHHLGLKITNCIKSNTNQNQNGSTAEGNIDSADTAEDYGENCYNA